MNAALGALVIQAGFCALGLATSLRLDLQNKVARRKPNALPKRLPLICFNIAMINVLLPGAVWLLGDRFPLTAPSLGAFLGQLAIIFVCDDFWFYWVHRAMHRSRWLYRHIHKYHHEAAAPVAIEFIYVHPLEIFATGTGTSLGLAVALLAFGQISAWTLWCAVTVRLAHELGIHSALCRMVGATLPVPGSVERHARHHERATRGNYASTFPLWDRIFHTESSA